MNKAEDVNPECTYEELLKDRERLEWLRENIDSTYTRENIDKAMKDDTV